MRLPRPYGTRNDASKSEIVIARSPLGATKQSHYPIVARLMKRGTGQLRADGRVKKAVDVAVTAAANSAKSIHFKSARNFPGGIIRAGSVAFCFCIGSGGL